MQKATGIKQAVGVGLLLLGCDDPFYCDQALSCDVAEAGATAEAGKPESETGTTSDPSSEATIDDAGPELPASSDTPAEPEYGDKEEVPGTPSAKPGQAPEGDTVEPADGNSGRVLDAGNHPGAETPLNAADASVFPSLDAAVRQMMDASPDDVEGSNSPNPTDSAPTATEGPVTDTETDVTNSEVLVDAGQPELSTVEVPSDPVTLDTSTTSCGTVCEDAAPPEEPCTDPTECGSWSAAKSIDAQVSGNSSTPEVAVDDEGRCGVIWIKDTQDWFNVFDAESSKADGAALLPIEDRGGALALVGETNGFSAIQTSGGGAAGVFFMPGLGLDEPITVERLDSVASIHSRRVVADRDANGNLLVAWEGGGQPLSNRFDASLDGWIGAEPISDASGAYNLLAITTALGGVAAWMKAAPDNKYEVMVASYEGEGPWENTKSMGLGSVHALQEVADGVVTLLYDSDSNDRPVLADFDVASATWGAGDEIPEDESVLGQFYDSLVRDTKGGLWVVGLVTNTGLGRIGVRHRTQAGAWEPLEIVASPTVEGGDVYGHAIAVDAEGNLFMAWRDEHDEQSDVWARTRSSSSSELSEPKRISAEAYGGQSGMRVITTGVAKATLVWRHSGAAVEEANEIWASRFQ